ncbi:MAG: helix-turn-helix domain-containing protein [Solirubrobacterales bacterium]
MSIDIAALFGDNLKRQRRLADLSQDETAVRASLHRTEISYLERGLRLARADTIAKLAGALEIDAGELFAGIAWTPGDVRYGSFVEARGSRPGNRPTEVRVERPTGS